MTKETRRNLTEAKNKLLEITGQLNGIREELQTEFDNLSSSWQQSGHGDALQERITALEELHDTLQSAEADLEEIINY